MANKKNKPLFGGFDRLQSFPLDSSSVFETWEELQAYLHSNIAYHGQLVVCLDQTDMDKANRRYGAYIIQDKTGTSGTKVFWPYKLYGADEFAKEVGILQAKLNELGEDLTTLTEEDVATLRNEMDYVNTWLDNATLDGQPIFATKTQFEELSAELERRFNELLGDEFTAKLDDLENYRPTINRLWGFVETYGPMIESAIHTHGERITLAEARINTHADDIADLQADLAALELRVRAAEEKFAQLADHERRISGNEAEISRINTSLESVEHFVEYDFDSTPTIAGMEFTPNMVIKSIEIVISETGEDVPGGLFNEHTKLTVDLPSKMNSENVHDVVINSNEIVLFKDVKMIFDIDFMPQYVGYLRFAAENSVGLQGHALVKYFTRVNVPVQPEPVVEPQEPIEEPVEPEEPIIEEPQTPEEPQEEPNEPEGGE